MLMNLVRNGCDLAIFCQREHLIQLTAALISHHYGAQWWNPWGSSAGSFLKVTHCRCETQTWSTQGWNQICLPLLCCSGSHPLSSPSGSSLVCRQSPPSDRIFGKNHWGNSCWRSQFGLNYKHIFIHSQNVRSLYKGCKCFIFTDLNTLMQEHANWKSSCKQMNLTRMSHCLVNVIAFPDDD